MVKKHENGQYEVLSPWAEADPVPLKGISPRLQDLTGKKIGMFCNFKSASKEIMSVVESKLKERYPGIITSRYEAREIHLVLQMESKDRSRFEEWVKSVDAVIGAVGD
ncbi:hypothetical protein ACFL7M_07160 [Thermodesulfobacteriota bacterium]